MAQAVAVGANIGLWGDPASRRRCERVFVAVTQSLPFVRWASGGAIAARNEKLKTTALWAKAVLRAARYPLPHFFSEDR